METRGQRVGGGFPGYNGPALPRAMRSSRVQSPHPSTHFVPSLVFVDLEHLKWPNWQHHVLLCLCDKTEIQTAIEMWW